MVKSPVALAGTYRPSDRIVVALGRTHADLTISFLVGALEGSEGRAMLTYRVSARRTDAHGGLATAKSASVVLDTDLSGRDDALNPVELLLAALAACIIKGIERVAPMIHFAFEDVEVDIVATRQDAPPKLIEIRYRLLVKTTESDQRLELLHVNVGKYGTIYNTLASGTDLQGTIGRLE